MWAGLLVHQQRWEKRNWPQVEQGLRGAFMCPQRLFRALIFLLDVPDSQQRARASDVDVLM